MKKRLILDANILINFCSNIEKTHNEIDNIFMSIRIDEVVIMDKRFYNAISQYYENITLVD